MARAFVNVDGQWWNLKQQLSNGAGWQIDSVSAINNSGLIVGIGLLNDVQTGFVMTPSAAPGLAGDFDQDGQVDGNDFLLWKRDVRIGNLAG